jgi:Protein of Unknown function (DUF2784)
MFYRLLADFVLVIHFCFVLFVVFGGWLVLRRRLVAVFHIPAVVWAILIEFFWWTCPLTTIENILRQRGGESGYEGGFIDYYVSLVLYIPLAPSVRFALGFALIGLNLFFYWYAFRRVKIV